MTAAGVTEIQAAIERLVSIVNVELVPLDAALARVLTEEVIASFDVPSRIAAEVEGFALRAEDTPGRLSLLGQLGVGERFDGRLGRRQAIQLYSGTPVPEGADAVVPSSQVRVLGDEIEIAAGCEVGSRVLAPGSDVAATSVVLRPGRRLRAHDLALASLVGRHEVEVRRRPRVRIVEAGPSAEPESPRASARLVARLAARDGAVVERIPSILGDREALEAALVGHRSDLVCIVGRPGGGMEHVAHAAIESVGSIVHAGAALHPAETTIFGALPEGLVIALPGHPVSAKVAWDLFGRLAVQRAQGASARLPYRKVQAILTKGIDKEMGRTEVVHVAMSDVSHGPYLATPLTHGEAFLSTVVRADGFCILEPETGPLDAGDGLDVHADERG